MIITIDGTVCSGKSTVAKRLAKKLGFVYCNTGAIYRAVAIKIVDSFGEEYYNEDEFIELIKSTKIDEGSHNGEFYITLDGKDVTNIINTPRISDVVAKYAKIQGIRDSVKKLQKDIAYSGNSVAEGRDLGTVVFPNAEVKFYMTAPVDVRAKRRMADYEKKGENVLFEKVKEEIIERDLLDTTRSVSPLKPAEDAIIINNDGDDADAMVNTLYDIVIEKAKKLNIQF